MNPNDQAGLGASRRVVASATMLVAALLCPGGAVWTIGQAPANEPRTLRVDYVHTGFAGEERFALERVAMEGPWPGAPEKAIDETNLGKYFVEAVDRKTNRVLYSRGFASVFGEWETTDEAKTLARAFHESVRMPAPSAAVQVVLKKRDQQNAFREVWSVVVDPAAPAVTRAKPPAAVSVWAVQQSGPSQSKVDVLLIGDGYAASEMEKWHADASRLAEALFVVSPFREHREQFNIWAIDVASDESGVARPSQGIHRRSAVGATYDAFGTERYVLTFENARLRDVASAAPYEFIEIVVNNRTYGGGGIHNQYATVAADNAFTSYVFVHEFGHHFAGLADEYYTPDVAYRSAEGRPEPWERNVTADPKAAKWRDLLTPGVTVPTPWPKAEFETRQRDIQTRRRQIRSQGAPETDMEALFREDLAFSTELLNSGPHAGKVGAFEGALYEATGYYRPQADCIMFSRDDVGFCAVCKRAIEEVIALYAK